MSELGLTKKNYLKLAKIQLRHKAHILAPYKAVTKYRKQFCTPRGVKSENREASVPMQQVLNHYLERLLSAEMALNLRDRMVELKLQGYTFRFHFKYGAGLFY